MYARINVCMRACMCVYLCLCVCMFAWIMSLCMHGCMYICIGPYMYIYAVGIEFRSFVPPPESSRSQMYFTSDIQLPPSSLFSFLVAAELLIRAILKLKAFTMTHTATGIIWTTPFYLLDTTEIHILAKIIGLSKTGNRNGLLHLKWQS